VDLRIFTEPQQGASYDDLLRVAKATEAAGYDAFFRSDHYLKMGSADGLPGPTDAWITLAGLARETSRIRLGTLVTAATFRHPGPLAISVAQVDRMSGGRVEFGIGAGWFEAEYRQYGYEFPPRPATRIRQMEEGLKLIMALWSGKRTTFEGKYFQVKDAILEPKPVQKPHPPIMIGGGGEQLTLRAVARHADACNVGGSPDQVRHKYEVLKRHCEAEGRNYDEIERTSVISFVLARDEAALAAKRQKLGVSPQFYGFAGTVAQVTDLVGKYRDAGTQLLISSAYKNDAETLELLAADVMPKFAG